MELCIFLLHSIIRCYPLSILSFFPSLTWFLVYLQLSKKMCLQLKMTPLTHAVHFAVCSPLQSHQVSVCLQTKRMGQLVSLTVCSDDQSMGITVNTLSWFCRVVECLLLMDTPMGCFPLRPIEALHRLGMGCRSQAVQNDQSHCPQN